MRPLWVTILFLTAVFIGGALAAPQLYFLAQKGASNFSSLESLARQPFHRFVSRSFLVLALAGLWSWMRAMGLNSLADLGWTRTPDAPRLFFRGFVWGLASLAVLLLVSLAAGGRAPSLDHTAGEWAKRIFSAALSGFFVAMIEETLFRGGMFGAFRGAMNPRAAMWISCVVFALLHFLDRRPEPPAVVGWSSGLALLPRMVREIHDWRMFAAAVASLTLVGLFLCIAYEKTGSLYFSAGLHAGWVFWMKMFGFVTTSPPDAALWLWGTGRLVDGWATFALLLASLLVYQRLPPPREKISPPADA